MEKIEEEQKSIGGNIWKIASVNDYLVENICQKYNLPYLVAKLLVLRENNPENIQTFLNPKIQSLLPNPSCLKDMDKAAERIATAIIKQEKIAIIGDYDVDGATSSSVLRLYLESVGIEPEVHIPDREEGYGPSKQAIDEFLSLGIDLVITTDCGTTAFEVFDYAKEKNIPVIVLDHHEAEVKLPDVYALVNPKRLDDDSKIEYLQYLAAVGVVFMTIVAINRELRKKNFFNQERPEPNLLKWLDLVALGTVCDVVPLKGLNRAFVRQGLKIMSLRENQGIRALADKAGITEAPTTYHLGYVLGPRINACGRVGDSSFGNKLLCAKDAFQADMIADKLGEFNAQRKEIENYVMLKAIEILEGTPQTYPMAFVSGTDWHQGVIGIVAGKLKERYNLPAFVMSVEADEVKGSARSIPQIDLGALIIAAKERGVITKGGGHTMAAGFSLEENKIEEFKKFVGEYIQEKIGQEDITPIINIDGELELKAANIDLAEKLELLEPFGAGNTEPKILLHKVSINKASIIGSGHIRCFLSSVSGGSLKAIAFRVADNSIGQAMLNAKGEIFDVVGVLRKDTWQGRSSVQFMIEDIKRC